MQGRTGVLARVHVLGRMGVLRFVDVRVGVSMDDGRNVEFELTSGPARHLFDDLFVLQHIGTVRSRKISCARARHAFQDLPRDSDRF
jgi:hypothetical protein